MTDRSVNLILSPCMHRHVVIETTGSRQFIQGEASDDIRERLRCLDCLEYLEEAEVRAAWMGDSHFIDPGEMEETHDNE